jgi:hypothetical protein
VLPGLRREYERGAAVTRFSVGGGARFVGADLGVDFPCGCVVSCIDSGLHVKSCDDPAHINAHRDLAQTMAARRGLTYVEVEDEPETSTGTSRRKGERHPLVSRGRP